VSIEADIRAGTLRDAVLYSVGANGKHGMPPSNDDKRKAVLVLLNDAEWSAWSDREIAKQCHVSHQMVCNYRSSLSTVDSENAAERSNDDKRKAVLRTLELAPDWSNRQIAKHVGVSDPFVGACRSPEVAVRQQALRDAQGKKAPRCNPIAPITAGGLGVVQVQITSFVDPRLLWSVGVDTSDAEGLGHPSQGT